MYIYVYIYMEHTHTYLALLNTCTCRWHRSRYAIATESHSPALTQSVTPPQVADRDTVDKPHAPAPERDRGNDADSVMR